MREKVGIILAAGKGTRMKSDTVKVTMQISGKPIVKYVVDACIGAGIKRIIVGVGYKAENVIESLGYDFEYVLQKSSLVQDMPLCRQESYSKISSEIW